MCLSNETMERRDASKALTDASVAQCVKLRLFLMHTRDDAQACTLTMASVEPTDLQVAVRGQYTQKAKGRKGETRKT